MLTAGDGDSHYETQAPSLRLIDDKFLSVIRLDKYDHKVDDQQDKA